MCKARPCTVFSRPMIPRELWTSLATPPCPSHHSAIVQLQPLFQFVIRDPLIQLSQAHKISEQCDTRSSRLQSSSIPVTFFNPSAPDYLTQPFERPFRVIPSLPPWLGVTMLEPAGDGVSTPAIRSLAIEILSISPPQGYQTMYSVLLTPP